MKTLRFPTLPLVSCRKDTDSNYAFNDSILWFKSPPLKDARTCVLVHGFNSNYPNTLKAYQTVAENLLDQNLYDAVVGFMWPGWNLATYPVADKNTTKAAIFLAQSVAFLKTQFSNTIDIQGHSLGCKVAIKALSLLSPSPSPIVNQVFLTAPAMPFDALQKNPTLNAATTLPTVIHWSTQDKTLKLLYRTVPYNWITPAMGAVGPSPKTTNVISHDLSHVVTSHSDYRNHQEFYDTFRPQID